MPCLHEYFIENNLKKLSKDFEEPKGTIIYEVLRIIDGVPLFLENHLERMNNSFKIIDKVNPYKDEEIKNSIIELSKTNKVKDGNVKITIEAKEDNKLKIFFIPHSYPTEEQYLKGVKTILYFGERTNPNAKIVNDSFRDLVNKEIKENNAYEAILVDRNGDITEGSRSNIFMVKNNTILTSPLEAVLPGVTRGEIIELCLENNVDFKEEKVNYKDLDRLDGLFITGTSPKILPITSVNDRIFNSNVNEIIKVLIKTYDDKINTYVNANKSNL